MDTTLVPVHDLVTVPECLSADPPEEEKLDQALMQALIQRDEKFLRSVPQTTLMQGTSEIRNWIAAAGTLAETELDGSVIDYVPCYRTEAGTGTAQGFMVWR